MLSSDVGLRNHVTFAFISFQTKTVHRNNNSRNLRLDCTKLKFGSLVGKSRYDAISRNHVNFWFQLVLAKLNVALNVRVEDVGNEAVDRFV